MYKQNIPFKKNTVVLMRKVSQTKIRVWMYKIESQAIKGSKEMGESEKKENCKELATLDDLRAEKEKKLAGKKGVNLVYPIILTCQLQRAFDF